MIRITVSIRFCLDIVYRSFYCLLNQENDKDEMYLFFVQYVRMVKFNQIRWFLNITFLTEELLPMVNYIKHFPWAFCFSKPYFHVDPFRCFFIHQSLHCTLPMIIMCSVYLIYCFVYPYNFLRHHYWLLLLAYIQLNQVNITSHQNNWCCVCCCYLNGYTNFFYKVLNWLKKNGLSSTYAELHHFTKETVYSCWREGIYVEYM